MIQDLLDFITETILSANWMQDFIFFLIGVLMAIVSILLMPISILLAAMFPDFDGALNNIASLFGYASTYMSWLLDAFAVPPIVITLMVGYFTFTVISRLAFWGFKVGLNWKKAIR